MGTKPLFRLCGATVLLSTCIGCWSAPPPGRITAYGKVNVNGKPIHDGQITFESVEDGIGSSVTRIGAGGRFQLFLYPSTYRIGIISVEGGVSPAGLGAVEKSKIRVPVKYAIPGRSGIERKIDAKNRTVALDLEP